MGLDSLYQEEKTGNPLDSLERKHVCWPRGARVTMEPLWEHLVPPPPLCRAPQHCLKMSLLIGVFFALNTHMLSSPIW